MTTATVQLSPLAKRCGFSSITVTPKLALEPLSYSWDQGFGKQWTWNYGLI